MVDVGLKLSIFGRRQRGFPGSAFANSFAPLLQSACVSRKVADDLRLRGRGSLPAKFLGCSSFRCELPKF